MGNGKVTGKPGHADPRVRMIGAVGRLWASRVRITTQTVLRHANKVFEAVNITSVPYPDKSSVYIARDIVLHP